MICGLANAADAVELLCISFIAPALDGVGDAETATLAASVFVGMLLGGFSVGVLSDMFGRKRLLALSLGVNAAFGCVSALAPSWPLLAACRVLAGVGVGASIPGVFSLMTELVPTSALGRFISLVAWHWMAGTVYGAGLAWTMMGLAGLSWRWFALGCAVPAALACVLVCVVLPESPRWLAGTGRAAEAQVAIAWMARLAGRRVPVLDRPAAALAVAPVVDTSTIELGSPTALSGADAAAVKDAAGEEARDASGASDTVELLPLGRQKHATAAAAVASPVSRRGCGAWCAVPSTVRDLFSTSMRRETLLLMCVWFCLCFGWYGLVLWIPTLFAAVDFDLNPYQDAFLVAAANLPGNVLAILLMDRMPRPWLLSSSLLLACGCALLFGFGRSEAMVVTAACLMNAISVCSWNSLDVLSVERFPTRLRSSAMGLLSACGRVGSIAGQYVFGAMLSVSITALLGVAGAVLFIGAACALALSPKPAKEAADVAESDKIPVH